MNTLPKALKDLLETEIDPAFAQRAQFIFDNIECAKPKYILDAGCGRGFYSHASALFSFVKKIYGIDINKKYLQIAKTHCTNKKIVLKESSLYSLPFADNTFDCIIFSEVLEHLSNEKKALNELSRVLKQDGMLLLTVPNSNYPFLWDPVNWFLEKIFKTHIPKHIWWLAGIWADHERLYSQLSLKTLLQKNDFKIQTIKATMHWCWPFSHFFLYGIGKNMISFLNIQQVNRFNFSPKKPIIHFLAKLFIFPSLLFDKKIPLRSSVNLLSSIKKC